MSFFRSEPMSLCQIILHTESAFNCLIVLGYEGKVQFRNIYDGNPLINHQYTTEIKRCQELKRIISFLQQEANECNIKTVIYPDVDEDEIPEANDLKTTEALLQQISENLMQVAGSVATLNKQRIQMSEHLQVLQRADVYFGANNEGAQAVMAWSDSVIKMLMKNELNVETSEGQHLSFFTGTIPVGRFPAFETMLWRVTKGHCYMKHDELFLTSEEKIKYYTKNLFTRKYVFILFFTGIELRKKIAKICQGFGVKLYECPESLPERQDEEARLRKELFDLDIVLERTQEQRYDLLLAASADLYIWRTKINKMLMVYYIMNRMGHVKHLHMHKYLQVKCWIPTKDIPAVRTALRIGVRRTAQGNYNSMFLPMLNEITRRHLKDTDKPTYFVLNKFTKGFQNLVDSYGVAQYRELNPAPYTIITFPFLFAVMFGDVGHGLIMLLFGIWMILREKYLEEKNRFAPEPNEIFIILFNGRYVITLMGAFSIYTGFIYNDCLSKGFNIFGSSWRSDFNVSTVNASHEIQLDPSSPEHYLGTPYVAGMDPVWKVSGENSITTFNSLKMKLAIIFGVAQMCFGLILSAFNFVSKREYVNLLLVFLPQLTFLMCIFVYLVFLIFFKWIQFGGHMSVPYNSACAPSVLIVFINMLMMKGPEEPPAGCEAWMFEFQPYFQIFLLTLALISIPVLLAGKPIYFTMQEKKIQRIKNEEMKNNRKRSTGKSIRESLVYNVESTVHSVKPEHSKREAHNTEADLSELWIHSAIQCIESVLGSVSHTASYLRLWALSLAHDQLSTVLWNMVLRVGLTGKRGYWNSLVLYAVFIIWSALTVAILVVMEGLSAFLHTLRLHWVEFQSKFYAGSGEVFQPFRFATSSPHNPD